MITKFDIGQCVYCLLTHPYTPESCFKVPYKATIKNIYLKNTGIYYELEGYDSANIPEEDIYLTWEEMATKAQDLLEKFILHQRQFLLVTLQDIKNET